MKKVFRTSGADLKPADILTALGRMASWDRGTGGGRREGLVHRDKKKNGYIKSIGDGDAIIGTIPYGQASSLAKNLPEGRVVNRW